MFQGWAPGFQGLPLHGHQESRQHRWEGKLTLAAAGLPPAVAVAGRTQASVHHLRGHQEGTGQDTLWDPQQSQSLGSFGPRESELLKFVGLSDSICLRSG